MSLRDLVGRQGLVSRECSLHSGVIGGATRLAAGGVSIIEIQRQGRWKGDACIMCAKTTKEQEDKDSRFLAFTR